MNEEVNLYLEDTKDQMHKAILHLENELAKLRAGKANPFILNGIHVDYYGTKTPLNQVSSINTSDSRTLVIQPWDKKMLEVIEKAILAANIGLTPINNGEVIRLVMPPLTEERRKELVKQVKADGEQARVSIRNTRRETNEEIKKLQKKGIPEDEITESETEVQKLTDIYSKKIDEVLHKKETEIMTV
jgi:ribosome recycling factor